MDKLNKIPIKHKPDWAPVLSSLLGDLRGQYGYITEIGTVALVGPNPKAKSEIPKSKTQTEIKGPLLVLSAVGGMF